MTNTQHGRLEQGPARAPHCLCGATGVRNDRWDAYYCPAGGAWLEERCSDPECDCQRRPEVAP